MLSPRPPGASPPPAHPGRAHGPPRTWTTTPDRLADALGTSTARVLQWVCDGCLPMPTYACGQYRWRDDVVEQILGEGISLPGTYGVVPTLLAAAVRHRGDRREPVASGRPVRQSRPQRKGGAS